MKVKELIKKLEKMPHDVDVVFTYIKNEHIEYEDGIKTIVSDESECEEEDITGVSECIDYDDDGKTYNYVMISNTNEELFG